MSNRTFGVEIETAVPYSPNWSVNGYHANTPLRITDPNHFLAPLHGWRMERDGSIRTPNSDYLACEFVSPVLQGEVGLGLMSKAIVKMREMGAVVNESCGVHINIQFPKDEQAMKRLLNLCAAHEEALFAITGCTKRERNNYCVPTRHNFRSTDTFKKDGWGGIGCTTSLSKYSAVNFSKLQQSSTRIVEFRLFRASLNEHEIIAWVKICLALVEKAIESKRVPKWERKDTVLTKQTRKHPAWSHFNLLMYTLGWVRGRSFVMDGTAKVHKTWGEVNGPNLPTTEESRAVLKQLVTVYCNSKKSEMATV